MWDCLRSVVDTGNWSGISVESCTWSQNQGIPGQPGVIRMMRQTALPSGGEPWEGKHQQ